LEWDKPTIEEATKLSFALLFLSFTTPSLLIQTTVVPRVGPLGRHCTTRRRVQAESPAQAGELVKEERAVSQFELSPSPEQEHMEGLDGGFEKGYEILSSARLSFL